MPLRISFLFCKGGIAQLGERLHGMQEVSGSIPLTSTTEQSEVDSDAKVSDRKDFTRYKKLFIMSFFADH